MHPVVGVRVVDLFVADFLDQPGERRAGNITHIDLIEFVSRALRLFHFRLYYLVQPLYLRRPDAQKPCNLIIQILIIIGKSFRQPQNLTFQ